MKELIIEFIKVGLLTFGGGSAATPIIHERLVEEKKWITEDEFIDIVAMANVLPGPSMIQMASLIGLKRKNKAAAVASAFAISAPSIIIFVLVMVLMGKFVDPVFLSKVTLPLFILIGLSMFLTSKQIFENNLKTGVIKNTIITVVTFVAIVFFNVPAVAMILLIIGLTLLKGVMFK